MPITKSTKKAVRKNIKRAIKNKKKLGEMKNLLKKVRILVFQKKIEEAKKILPQIYKILDKAAKNGLIKKNKADRLKSRATKNIAKNIQK